MLPKDSKAKPSREGTRSAFFEVYSFGSSSRSKVEHPTFQMMSRVRRSTGRKTLRLLSKNCIQFQNNQILAYFIYIIQHYIKKSLGRKCINKISGSIFVCPLNCSVVNYIKLFGVNVENVETTILVHFKSLEQFSKKWDCFCIFVQVQIQEQTCFSRAGALVQWLWVTTRVQKRSLVRILAPYTGWIFFHIDFVVKIVLFV